MTTGSDRAAPPDVVAWHDVECGSYGADLALWEELTAGGDGPVLELGSGTGRVALHLAKAGRDVIAVERDPELAAELERRAATAELRLTVLAADIRELRPDALPHAPARVIAPMHVLQTFDRAERDELASAAARLLAPGGTLAAVLIDEAHLASLTVGDPILYPDIREIDGWVFSSEPLWVQMTDEAITARRLRRAVAPDGELDASVHDVVLYRTPPEELERLGEDLGLRVAKRRRIETSEGESDSTVVVLEAP